MKPILQKMLKIEKPSQFVPILFFLLYSLSLQAAWFDRLPYTVTQPDGTSIECFASGDEYFNWLHDDDGFTIIVGEDGFYYYGKVQGDFVVPTSYRVNSVNPISVGLEPWAKISKKEYLKIKDEFWKDTDKSVKAPHTGTLNSLTVYIRFSDQSEFTLPRSFYDARFNAPDAVSMKNYFEEVSYEQLYIDSYHYPICEITTNLSYQDVYPRNYYEPYHAVNNPNGYQGSTQRRIREHTLLMNAINFIAPEVPTDMVIDGDNDGYVDNVCFLIRGNSGAWADLLWAHRWVLYSFNVYIHGKQVYDYTFQPENQNNVQTLCHEMFHVLSAPDLYHYTGNGISPAGPWDLMESGFGHMLAFMKYKYADQKWVTEIPEITTAGTYTLNPLTSPENNAFKIASPNSSVEYFVVEYRRRTGLYETNLPGDGLLVYRIDPSAGNGNASGPPDEVYVYRPNGTMYVNGSVNQANFSLNVGRTEINDDTNPSSFLQYGGPGGLNIFNITAIGETISFDILMGTEVDADFAASQTTIPNNGTTTFNDLSTNLPINWEWFFEGGTPDYSTEQNPEVQYTTNGMYSVSLTAANQHGSGSVTKDNYIIVGTPSATVNPTSFEVAIPANSNTTQLLDLANVGDTWLRYNLEYAILDEGSQVLNTGTGTILGTYENLPTSRSGMTWAEGLLYVVHMNIGTLSVYDTLVGDVVASYPVHNNPFSIVYDGELLWIGSDDGLLRAYDTDGTFTENTIDLPSYGLYGLAWDGNHFILNQINNIDPDIIFLDQSGLEVATFSSDVSSRIMQMVWVTAHDGGSLWGNLTGKIARLALNDNVFVIADEFSSPSNISYSLAHDGTDLWWSSSSGLLYKIDDGFKEWLVISWNQGLLEAGLSHNIPVFFNAKDMEVGEYLSEITLLSNDPSNGTVIIPVTLTVTDAVGISTPLRAETAVNVRQGMINVFPASQLFRVEVYDLNGRLVSAVDHNSGSPLQISNLKPNMLYLLRLLEEGQSSARKIYLY